LRYKQQAYHEAAEAVKAAEEAETDKADADATATVTATSTLNKSTTMYASEVADLALYALELAVVMMTDESCKKSHKQHQRFGSEAAVVTDPHNHSPNHYCHPIR